MNLVFSEPELNRVRQLQGATIHSIHSCHPWFRPHWEGSRRLDLATSVGDIGFALQAQRYPSTKILGEIFTLRIIPNAKAEPWPLDQHKGFRRVSQDDSWRTRTVQSIALKRQTLTLSSSTSNLTLTRDLGFAMKVLQLEGGQIFNFQIAMQIEQNETEVVAGYLESSENRFGIHSHPGHPIVELGVGDLMHVQMETIPLTP